MYVNWPTLYLIFSNTFNNEGFTRAVFDVDNARKG